MKNFILCAPYYILSFLILLGLNSHMNGMQNVIMAAVIPIPIIVLCKNLLIGFNRRSIFGFLLYLPWLFKEIINSAIFVVLFIFRSDKNVNYSIRSIKVKNCSDLEVVLFANSITLTPGTVTIDVIVDSDGASFLVQALNDSLLDELENGVMYNRIKDIKFSV